MLVFSGIEDTSFNLNIPASINRESWDSFLEVGWYVEAVSGTDEVTSEDEFVFWVNRFNDVEGNSTGNIPDSYSIVSAYPNPFNPSSTITIGLPEAAELSVRVLNILGREVVTIADGKFSSGYHTLVFEAGDNLSSGIYFIRATSPGRMDELKKITLIR
jgi:hypothetical protein